jgi:GNAT superfamily N-acetyltransferase
MARATPDDLKDVMSLLNQRIKWLRDIGSDQWNTGRTFENRMVNSIARRETWLLRDEGEPIATLSLSTDGDPDFWTPEEFKEAALYLGKMATSLSRRGEDLGRLLLMWTQDFAFKANVKIIRWDVWRTNERLQKYYRAVGARYLRTEDVADRWSGSLFELDARPVPHLETQMLTKATSQ